MKLVKSIMKQKENELYKKQGCRVFAVRVKSAKFLSVIINRVISELQPNGFMHYLYPYSPTAIYVEEKEPNYKDSIEEFKENGGEEDCAILFNDDLAIAYPDPLSLITKRYKGIKIYDQSYFIPS